MLGIKNILDNSIKEINLLVFAFIKRYTKADIPLTGVSSEFKKIKQIYLLKDEKIYLFFDNYGEKSNFGEEICMLFHTLLLNNASIIQV